jgi:acid phosphatase (class A)
MRNSASLIALVVFLTSFPSLAFERTIVTREQVDLTKLLPPPPQPGSPEQAADEATVLDLQRLRTPSQVTEAVGDNKLSVFRFADVLGPDFNPDKLPLTTRFFGGVYDISREILVPTKSQWTRPRPFIVLPELNAVGEKPSSYSYPSGHAHFGYLVGVILAQMVPEKASQLFARGGAYGENRILAGVHFPTDVKASQRGATAAALFQNASFRAEMDAATEELRQVLKLSITK